MACKTGTSLRRTSCLVFCISGQAHLKRKNTKVLNEQKKWSESARVIATRLEAITANSFPNSYVDHKISTPGFRDTCIYILLLICKLGDMAMIFDGWRLYGRFRVQMGPGVCLIADVSGNYLLSSYLFVSHYHQVGNYYHS